LTGSQASNIDWFTTK